MLRTTCEKCDGNGYIERGSEFLVACSCKHGYIDAPVDKKVYVNVYLITRHYGGPEEGGWYYNWYNCVETVTCKNKDSDEIKSTLEEEYGNRKHGDIYSVLGGQDVLILIEEEMKASETKERPYYE